MARIHAPSLAAGALIGIAAVVALWRPWQAVASTAPHPAQPKVDRPAAGAHPVRQSDGDAPTAVDLSETGTVRESVIIEDPAMLLQSSRRVDQARAIELLVAAGTPQALQQLLGLYLATDDPVLIALLEEALLLARLDVTGDLLEAFRHGGDQSRALRIADLLVRLAGLRPDLAPHIGERFLAVMASAVIDEDRRAAARNALLALGSDFLEPVASLLTDPATSDAAAGAAAWMMTHLGPDSAVQVQDQLSSSVDAALKLLASGSLPKDQAQLMTKKLQWLSWVGANRPAAEHDALVGLYATALGRARNEAEAMPLAWGIANTQGVSHARAVQIAHGLLDSLQRATDPGVRQSHVWAIHLLATGYGENRMGQTFVDIRELARARAQANTDPAVAAALSWLLTELDESERRANSR